MTNSTSSLLTQARSALSKGDKKAAIYWANKVLESEPQNITATMILAGTADSLQGTVGYLNRVLQLNPSHPQARQGLEWANAKAVETSTKLDLNQVWQPPVVAQPITPPLSSASSTQPAAAPVQQPAPATQTTKPPAQRKKVSPVLAFIPWLLGALVIAFAIFYFLGGSSAVMGLLNQNFAKSDEVTFSPAMETAVVQTASVIQATQYMQLTQAAEYNEALLFLATQQEQERLAALPTEAPPTATTAPPTAVPPTTVPSTETQLQPTANEVETTPTPAALAEASATETLPTAIMLPTETPDPSAPTAVPVVQITPIESYSPPPPVVDNGIVVVVPNPNPVEISPEVQAPQPAPQPAPVQPVSGDFWIDINLSQQMVYAYSGDTLLNSFVVSTGTWETPTVTGQYRVYVKYRYADMTGPGYHLPDVPYVMYFYQGYGLHGTYWHSNFGTPMSHGCVNLATPDAAWLYERSSVGTIVNVHY